MAAKKTIRGAALVKKAIEAATGKVASPEPVPAAVLKKLRLPNDEKLPAGLKTFLAFDASSLGLSFDDEEPEFESITLDELVADAYGEDSVNAFGEAVELLTEECIPFEDEGEAKSFLYVGSPDETGEYAVITIEKCDSAKVSGFVPFDVWVAQRYGVLPEQLPEDYVAVAQCLAEENGDGRRSFVSQVRDIEAGGEDDEDEDEEEDDAE